MESSITLLHILCAISANSFRNTDIELFSLVTKEQIVIIGHILFSPVTTETDTVLMGLATMAVLPQWQKHIVGTGLINAGLINCETAGYQVVIVPGHPDYFPWLGFVPCIKYGLEFELPAEVFITKELHPGGLKGLSATVKYHQLFIEL